MTAGGGQVGARLVARLAAAALCVAALGCGGSDDPADAQVEDTPTGVGGGGVGGGGVGGGGGIGTGGETGTGGDGTEEGGAAIAAQGSGWTVMIYMDVDNNLEAQKIRYNLEDAARIGSGPDLNVIALIDRSDADTSDPSAPDGPLGSIPPFTGAKLVRIDQGGFTELQDLGEIDMGDPQTLAWLVRQGVAQFPAAHYALWIADHGAGISGVAWDDSTPRDSAGRLSNLRLPEVTDGIAAGLAGTGVDKLDLVGYDACLMATYDAALLLAPVADYLMAAEEVTLTNTWKYGAALQSVAGDPAATGETMGRALVENSVDPGWPIGTNGLIDLSKMGIVRQAVESLAAAMEDDMAELAPELGRQRGQAPEFGRDPATGASGGYGLVDLGDLAARLQNVPPAVDTARQAVFQAIESAVVELENGPAATYATGLAIYFPTNAAAYDSEFDTLPTSRPWRSMLNAFFRSGGAVDPGPGPGAGGVRFESPTAQVDFVQGGALVSARMVAGTEQFVVDARFVGGALQPDGSVYHLVLSPATIGAGDPRTIAAGWGFGFVQLTDGATNLLASSVVTAVPDAVVFDIPVLYQAPDGSQQQASYYVMMDGNGQLIGQPALIGYGTDGSAAVLVPAAGSLVAPLVLVTPPGGQSQLQLVSNTALEGTRLSFGFATLASGSTFHAGLLATDASGATAFASATGIVP